MQRIPWHKLDWLNASFLVGMILLCLTAVPIYLWQAGLQPYLIAIFLGFFVATGISITLGYHRLFAHRAFHAHWSVRLLTLLFGAAAFENSALLWVSDHRRHHKHTDEEKDPYNIQEGFFHAHMGWVMLKDAQQKDLKLAADLQKDRMVMWQHNNFLLIAILMGFGLPTLIGLLCGGLSGALGGFLVGGVARIVFVQQMTFFINSLCHYVGRQPYSDRNSARDSGFMALFTFGEGYHNFHHSFQHDYRNGVKPWQFDPTKWSIWVLNRLGLASDLKRVPAERILQQQLVEQQRQMEARLASGALSLSDSVMAQLQKARKGIEESYHHWEKLEKEYRLALERKLEDTCERLHELQAEFHAARENFRQAVKEWRAAQSLALAQFA